MSAETSRFLRYVEVTDGCWLWCGFSDRDGYGRLDRRFSGVKRRLMAHRVSYELFVGAIPDGYEVDHLCVNRSCVNPDHLEAVTPAENRRRAVISRKQDGLYAGRQRQKPSKRLYRVESERCLHGHQYTPENTTTDSRGRRLCRRCYADQRAKYRQKEPPAECPDCGRSLRPDSMKRHRSRVHAVPA